MPDRTYQDALRANIRRLRKEAGLSQDDLAAAARTQGLAWSQLTVSAIERGKRGVTIGELLLLQPMLNRSLVAFLDPNMGDEEVLDVEGSPVRVGRWRSLVKGKPVSGAQSVEDAYRLMRIHVAPLQQQQADLARAYGIREDDLWKAWAAALEQAERKAARRLQVSELELGLASVSLWGHGLTEERDRILKASQGRGDQQRRLGHITRRLGEDLQERISVVRRARKRQGGRKR